MGCFRMDLWRSFSLYVSGELDARTVKRVEDHLLDCAGCRTRVARLRNGQRLAQEMPRFGPKRDPWLAIKTQIDSRRPAEATGWPRLVFKPSLALAAIGILALIAASTITYVGFRSNEQAAETSLVAETLDLSRFHTVSIADIDRNQKPHVMAEGYVSEVRVNPNDRDLKFKLVDDLERPGPFIICEIIDPFRLEPPAVGSRVRVYGVSRYDSQADHNWYEVHPVLNIQTVNR